MPKFGLKINVNKRLLEMQRPRVERALAPVVSKAAHDIKASSQRRIVEHDLIDTGHLLNSITVKDLGPLTFQINVGAFYGIFHEFGTKYMRARPFLGPAVDEVSRDFMVAVKYRIEQEFGHE